MFGFEWVFGECCKWLGGVGCCWGCCFDVIFVSLDVFGVVRKLDMDFVGWLWLLLWFILDFVEVFELFLLWIDCCILLVVVWVVCKECEVCWGGRDVCVIGVSEGEVGWLDFESWVCEEIFLDGDCELLWL